MEKIKYFAGFLKKQEKWLNKMSQDGYRLTGTGILKYTFEECEPSGYVYAVEYVGNKSFEEEKDYKAFLESCGYRVFYKNINIDFSYKKATMRPSAKGNKFTVSGTNKELLIIEKENDGKPFELHTTAVDKLKYAEGILKTEMIFAFLFLLGAVFMPTTPAAVIFGAVALLPVGLMIRTAVSAYKLKKEASLCEESEGYKSTLKSSVAVYGLILLLAIGFRVYKGDSYAPTSYSATRVMTIDKYLKGVWSYSSKMTEGRVSKKLKQTGDGLLTIEVETVKGIIGITVEAENGNVVYENSLLEEDITLNVPGKVNLVLQCSDWEGKITATH